MTNKNEIYIQNIINIFHEYKSPNFEELKSNKLSNFSTDKTSFKTLQHQIEIIQECKVPLFI